MPVKVAPNNGVLFGWNTGEDFWGGPMNENLVFFDTLIGTNIRSSNWSSPPPDAQEGSVYIVAEGAAAEWAGQQGMVAVMVEGAWRFFQPKRGWRVLFDATNSFIWYDGEKWIDEASGDPTEDPKPTENAKQYHVSVSVPYNPEPEEMLLLLPVVMPMMLRAGAPTSSLISTNPFSGNGAITIRRNGLVVGTIRLQDGFYNGQIEVPNTVTFSQGDRISLYAPYEKLQGLENFGLVLRFDIMGDVP